jgi:hypothetical protein
MTLIDLVSSTEKNQRSSNIERSKREDMKKKKRERVERKKPKPEGGEFTEGEKNEPWKRNNHD